MASTTFIDTVAGTGGSGGTPGTLIVASWLNDVNITVYTALGSGGVAPATAADVITNLDISTNTTLAATYETIANAAATYLTIATAASTYAPLTGTGTSGTWPISITGNAATATLATDVTNVTKGPLKGAVTNYSASAIGISNYSVVISADEAVLENSSNQYITERSVSLTIDANGTVGAPLSIMSARAASTWYYVWLWYNATLGLTATLDTSSTAPTAPTGYASTDYNARMNGAVRTDSSGSTYLLQTLTKGNSTQYVVLAGSNVAAMPLMSSGVQGSVTIPTWVAVATSAFVPTTASHITVNVETGSTAILAPNNSYGAASSTTNPPVWSWAPTSSLPLGGSQRMMLESGNIYWASSGASAPLSCLGWEDNL